MTGSSKKNLYRVLKRFATRRDLLVTGGGTPPAAVGREPREDACRRIGSCQPP